MSTWVKNVEFNDTVVNQLTSTPAPTAAPTPAPTTAPTTAPSYPNNNGFGGAGGVVFPLPVAPSLLMDGDITSLNPITPAPTPAPETLEPVPEMPMIIEEEDEPFWTWWKIAIVVLAVVLVAIGIWWMLKRNGKNAKKSANNINNGTNGKAANTNNTNINNTNNLNNANNVNANSFDNANTYGNANNANAWANNKK